MATPAAVAASSRRSPYRRGLRPETRPASRRNAASRPGEPQGRNGMARRYPAPALKRRASARHSQVRSPPSPRAPRRPRRNPSSSALSPEPSRASWAAARYRSEARLAEAGRGPSAARGERQRRTAAGRRRASVRACSAAQSCCAPACRSAQRAVVLRYGRDPPRRIPDGVVDAVEDAVQSAEARAGERSRPSSAMPNSGVDDSRGRRSAIRSRWRP